MPTPSLLIVPARFKSGKLYSQIPTSGAGDFTVTRATSATRVNASGLIESVASGIPRLDYFASGGTVGCPALLVEPSGSNLAFNSQTWASGNNWTLSEGGQQRVTVEITTSGTLAPDGLSTANAISPTSGNLTHYLVSNFSGTNQISFTSGTVYTQSAFYKQGAGQAGRYVQITYGSTRFSQLGYANFDLQLGTVSIVSGTSADTNRAAKIENYGNGWYRCSFAATCTATGTGTGVNCLLITASGSVRAQSFAGTTTDVLYGWGAQLETGSVATSYIPTTTGSVTRNADVVSVMGAVSGSIGQTQGTIYAEVNVRNWVSNLRILSISDGTSNNHVTLIKGSTENTLRLISRLSNVLQVSIQSSALTGNTFKIAAAYANNDFVLYINGAQIGTNNTALSPACSNVYLGSIESGAGTSALNDRIRAAALYTTRLTNDQLAALTTV